MSISMHVINSFLYRPPYLYKFVPLANLEFLCLMVTYLLNKSHARYSFSEF